MQNYQVVWFVLFKRFKRDLNLKSNKIQPLLDFNKDKIYTRKDLSLAVQATTNPVLIRDYK